jgi:hypothetical protein
MEFKLAESIRILERTPSILESLLSAFPKEWIITNEGPGTWNPFEVVGHLIEGEKHDWIPRMQIILSDRADKRFIPFDRYAHLHLYSQRTLNDLIREFDKLRTQNLLILKSTPIDDNTLNRKGVHPEFGEVTLRQLLATWVTHDLAHLTQITRVMAKHYREEIGPWAAYFNVFKK